MFIDLNFEYKIQIYLEKNRKQIFSNLNCAFISDQPSPTVLREVSLPILSNTDCADRILKSIHDDSLDRTSGKLPDHMICGGNNNKGQSGCFVS